MAKNKVPTQPVQDEDLDVINIDVQALLIPISILLSGLMISISLFLSIRSIGDTVLSSAGTLGVTPTEAPVFGKTTIDDDPLKGDKSKATVAVVEFSDYECPFCKQFYQETYHQLLTDYVDTGKIIWVFRDYIAVTAHNPAALNEATAAECVHKFSNNEIYFKYHDYLFEHTGSNGDGITDGTLKGQEAYVAEAVRLGINKDQFVQCLSDPAIQAEITNDETAATTLGVGGTPGFLVGKLDSSGNVDGKIVSGAQPLAAFKAAIDEQLQK